MRTLGHEIGAGSSFARGVVVDVDRFRIGSNVQVGPRNVLAVEHLDVGDDCNLGPGNHLMGRAWYAEGSDLANSIRIGHRVGITPGHHLDAPFGIEIGDDTWIAGCNSSFWTHGGGREQGPITIGADCYVASEVRVSTGVTIGEGSFVALASVVTESCPPRSLLAGHPAVVKRSEHGWRAADPVAGSVRPSG